MSSLAAELLVVVREVVRVVVRRLVRVVRVVVVVFGAASVVAAVVTTVVVGVVGVGSCVGLIESVAETDDALMMVRQRIIVIALFAWLPLLLLSGLEGNLWVGSTGVPFLFDVEVHVRFLVALPLLIAAELVVHRRMRPLLQQFLERNMIPGNAMARFEAAVASAFRLRNSVLAEVLLIAFVYGVGILVVWRQYIALDTATWYATPSAAGSQFSLAGMWYAYLSVPIFQFLLLRWYFPWP